MQLSSGKLISLASAIGLLSITASAVFHATSIQDLWQQAEQQKAALKADSDIEAAKAEEAKRVAEAYRKNRISSIDTLTVRGYVLNDKPPIVNWRYSLDPSRKTLIYDEYRRCAGYAYQGRFYHIKDNPQACEVNNG